MKEKLDKITTALLNEENIKSYRPIPFWSWNDKLEEQELRRQVRWMKEQGFGGYFMHAIIPKCTCWQRKSSFG